MFFLPFFCLQDCADDMSETHADRAGLCKAMVFVEPMDWMRSSLEKAEVEGKVCYFYQAQCNILNVEKIHWSILKCLL